MSSRQLSRGQSPFGAFDMAGNVAEWTSTPGADYNHSTNVVAGGSYLADPMEDPPACTLRADNVFSFGRSDAVVDIGFRCAADIASGT